ncbi:hypothetical protein C5142_17135 [Rhodococcus sp. BGS-1C]|uniref:hypothetical protein n=1 Tax=unclassified Rhodococcus (in: high G+C Gram-positive bacteria) TaxID=192944 RepID=UPI003D16203B
MNAPDDPVGFRSLVDLLEYFRDTDVDERTWLALVQSLLRWAVGHSPSAEVWKLLAAEPQFEDFRLAVQADVYALLSGPDCDRNSTFIDAATIVRLSAGLPRHLDVWSNSSYENAVEAIAAHAIACTVDAEFSNTFEEWFRAEIHVDVARDRVYPVARYNPKRFIGGHSANTKPSKLPSRALDCTEHLGLGDRRTTAYGLVIDYEHWHHLAPLSETEQLKIAAAQPNMSLSEYDIQEGPNGKVRNCGPSDPDRQHRRLVEIVRHSADSGVDVLVLPEYSLHSKHRNELQRSVDDLAVAPPSLIVAGTSEVHDGHGSDRIENHAWLMVAGGYGSSQGKVFAAEMSGHMEGIEPVGSVRIIRSEEWTIAVLICRDAMSPDLVDLLSRCGVNLLLVPAFSERTATIIGQATSLSIRSQAFVAVAVGPAVWTNDAVEDRPQDPTRVEAAFSGPYEVPPSVVSLPPEGFNRTSGRGLWVFDAVSRTTEWLEVRSE